jgi:hypothetical protein
MTPILVPSSERAGRNKGPLLVTAPSLPLGLRACLSSGGQRRPPLLLILFEPEGSAGA